MTNVNNSTFLDTDIHTGLGMMIDQDQDALMKVSRIASHFPRIMHHECMTLLNNQLTDLSLLEPPPRLPMISSPPMPNDPTITPHALGSVPQPQARCSSTTHPFMSDSSSSPTASGHRIRREWPADHFWLMCYVSYDHCRWTQPRSRVDRVVAYGDCLKSKIVSGLGCTLYVYSRAWGHRVTPAADKQPRS
jgi:hypothetical protein